MSEAQEQTPSNGNGLRRRLLTIVGIVVAVVGLAWFAWWYLESRNYESTDNAYVAGNIVQITSQISGTVVAINAEDTDFVPAGKVMVRLDPTDADVALGQAEAQLGQAVRQARTLFANNEALSAVMAERKSQIASAQADLDKTREDLARREKLVATGAVSREELQHAQTAVTNAVNELAAARSNLAGAQEQLSSSRALTEGTTVENHPGVQQAAARVREAYLARVRCDIVAPIAGQVAKRGVQVGQRIQPGVPLMTVIPLGDVWVDANFKENQLRNMRIGQPVVLHADIYGGKVEYRGRVVGLGAGTGAAFSLLPAQNATGNWIKVVQRVPVRIALDPAQLKQNPLRVGLSMEAEVEIRDASGPLLANAVRTSPVQSTTQLDVQAEAADALVNRIIAANNNGKVDTAKRGAQVKTVPQKKHGLSRI
ncbi:membrane fusion protein, multidrug efflux system [Novimethylophilus kurashikiensis]|uniref:Membrane fusion protein, multidrug efflux system n=1 Tax=Novimethylophilus kurashikiensis TaxID=1825523 RepID=A0A2R5F565_9PROT|nr:HlyD family efflux transporter periplasmic adaptor subunit [Novimethylophilus kurashikiensis]GBG13502.1 membrane fusion protein, multidrug efflux system [Novimethylophilus kurashikiensis]